MVAEFLQFLKEYKVIPLAIAFIMGVAGNQLIKSLVDNIIMAIITPLIPGGNWRASVLTVGPVKLGWGPFLSDLIYFTIVAFVVFLIAKNLLRQEKAGKT